jgi:hypothetical protein
MAAVDDAALVIISLLAVEQQLDLDTKLWSSGLDPQAQAIANTILEFQKETIRIIESHISRTPFATSISAQLGFLRR